MNNEEIDLNVQRLAQHVKHYLIMMMGKSPQEATDEEFYRTLAWVLREEIMINWTATLHTHMLKKARRVYYLSLEWLPGRLLVNNATNIASVDLVKKLIKYMGREYQSVLTTEAEPGLGNHLRAGCSG